MDESWFPFLLGGIIIFVAINVLKTLLKWVMVAIVIVVVFFHSGVTWQQLADRSVYRSGMIANTVQWCVMQWMNKELDKARYASQSNGAFTITSPNFIVKRMAGKSTLHVTFGHVSLGEWNMNDALHTYVQKVKKNCSRRFSTS